MTPRYKTSRVKAGGEELRQRILAAAGVPDGFAVASLKPEYTANAIHNAVEWMLTHGLIFKARISQMKIHFFTSQAEAETYVLLQVKPTTVNITMKAKSSKFDKEVTIIYPPGYKLTVHPTPTPRHRVIDVPFFHGGMRAMAHQTGATE